MQSAHLHAASFSPQERKNEALIHSIAELQKKVGWVFCVPQGHHSIPGQQRSKGGQMITEEPTWQRSLCWG